MFVAAKFSMYVADDERKNSLAKHPFEGSHSIVGIVKQGATPLLTAVLEQGMISVSVFETT